MPKFSLISVMLLIAAIGTAVWVLSDFNRDNADTLSLATRKAAKGGEVGSVVVAAPTAAPAIGDRLGIPDSARKKLGNAQTAFRPAYLGESVQSLMTTGDLVRVDYGMLRVRSRCLSALLGRDAPKAVKDSGYTLSMFKGADVFAVGNASQGVRTEAYARSYERCRALLEPALSDKEYVALTKTPASTKVLGIMRQLSSVTDTDSPEAKDALTFAVNGPMFGTLEALILHKVDFGGLETSYSPEQVSTLRPLIAEIVICRLGDDCDVGGIVTEQLCWQNGICGGSTEDAILANLRARGLDTMALSQFVTRVLLGLQASDTSIFRKQKPSK